MEEVPAFAEDAAQHFWEGEDKLAVGSFVADGSGDPCAGLADPALMTGGAEVAGFAGECEELFVAAIRALEAGEPCGEVATPDPLSPPALIRSPTVSRDPAKKAISLQLSAPLRDQRWSDLPRGRPQPYRRRPPHRRYFRPGEDPPPRTDRLRHRPHRKPHAHGARRHAFPARARRSDCMAPLTSLIHPYPHP